MEIILAIRPQVRIGSHEQPLLFQERRDDIHQIPVRGFGIGFAHPMVDDDIDRRRSKGQSVQFAAEEDNVAMLLLKLNIIFHITNTLFVMTNKNVSTAFRQKFNVLH
ncbi:hypothetical protein D3C73_1350030 [compost metagenome]